MRTVLLLSLLFFAVETLSCSSFAFRSSGSVIFNKSYDWKLQHAILTVNKRNVKKSSFGVRNRNVISWTSKYGSLTFNQYGREFPLGGINEKGLAIETLWLSSAQFPKNTNSKPAVNELQWVQYSLDRFSNVAEMTTKIKSLRIKSVFANVHHLACDATGDCASFEYINGSLVITKTSVLTNSTAKDSRAYLMGFKGFGGIRPVPMSSYASKSRFVRLNHLIRNTTDSFKMLSSVESVGYTKWQIAYDLTNKTIKIRIPGISRSKIMKIDINDFNFSCKKPVLVYDIEKVVDADIGSRFVKYTRAENKRVLEKGGAQHQFSRRLINAGIVYPESTRCTE